MKITDACVYPRPFGDSSVRRMALEAHELGFDSLVAVDTLPCEFAGVTVAQGVVILGMPAQEAALRVKRCRDTDAIVSVQAGDNRQNRTMLAMRGVHILCGIHRTDRYAFDHVTAKMAADNGVAVDISLAPIIKERGAMRQRVMDRYHDIVRLYLKFEFPLVISTHARSVLDMRSVRECSALVSLIGLDATLVEQALSNVGALRSPRSAVRVIR
jgi:ribonuclease P/MRP protein subunit RPP1